MTGPYANPLIQNVVAIDVRECSHHSPRLQADLRVFDRAAERTTAPFAGLTPVREAVDIVFELMLPSFAGMEPVELVVGRVPCW